MQTRQVKSSKFLRLNLYVILQPTTRSSRLQMFFKIGVPKHFIKFTGKYCAKVSFLIKLQASGLQGCNSIKKRLQHGCFSLNIAKFLRTAIMKNYEKLTNFSERLVFRELFFITANLTYLFLTFVSLNVFFPLRTLSLTVTLFCLCLPKEKSFRTFSRATSKN